jgi:hypothetical protein
MVGVAFFWNRILKRYVQEVGVCRREDVSNQRWWAVRELFAEVSLEVCKDVFT